MSIAYVEKGLEFDLKNERLCLHRQIEEGVWQIENVRTGKFIELTEEEFFQAYNDGEITLRGVGTQNLTRQTERCRDEVFEDLPQAMRKLVVERRAYVEAVRYASLKIFTKESLSPVIRQTWKRIKDREYRAAPDWTTVRRWFIRYERAGRDIAALIPRHARKGRKPQQVSPEMADIIDPLVDNMYLGEDERFTKGEVLEEAQYRINRENNRRPDGLKLPAAARWMIDRSLERYSAFDIHVARYGKESARRKYRGALNHTDVERPLQRVEADHTQLDLFAVDTDTGELRGRPWVTVFVDVATRCVLGFHITFTPPSYLSVARCLRHAVLPKTNLRERFTLLRHDWLAYGVPEELFVDNGMEFHSLSLEDAAEHLGMAIKFLPRKTPWFKGVVERWFRSLNEKVSHRMPGTTFRSIREREDYDPQRHAVIPLNKLEEIITRWIVDVYHQSRHSVLGTTPAQAWQDKAAKCRRALPVHVDELDAKLGKGFDRRLDHRGVQRNYLWYNSHELIEMRRRHGDVLSVHCTYDSEDLGSIFVFDPETKEPVEVPALRQDYAAGLDDWQHAYIRQEAKAREKDSEDAEMLLEVKHELREEIFGELHKPKSSKKPSCVTRLATLASDKAVKGQAKSGAKPTQGKGPAKKTTKVKPKDKGGTGSVAGQGNAPANHTKMTFKSTPVPNQETANTSTTAQ